MASIRQTILDALVARLATLDGWQAELRDLENQGNSVSAVQAYVFALEETKQIDTSSTYLARLRVGVVIKANGADADAELDAGNAYRYLDRLVTLVEQVVHSPDSWGLDPDFTDVAIDGHEVQDPNEGGQVVALVRLTFTYRHDYQDPEQ